MASDLLRERLPPGWHLGVTDDGRIFFIDDHRQETSWLHPMTGLPVESGMHRHPDLPPGWEQDSTLDGLTYYIDHNRGVTTFEHPLYSHGTPPPSIEDNEILNQQRLHQQLQQNQNHQLPPPGYQDRSIAPTQSPATPGSPTSPGGKENFKRGAPKQRSVKAPSAKRNPQAVVVKRGWLHRLENTGLSKSKAWKKRWCVLADFALFIYKGDDEQTTLDSILLPSYRINPSTEADNIKRNFVFKVEHENTKTLYLAAEDSPDSVSWMSHLRQAALMDGNIGFQREQNNFRQHPLKGGGGAAGGGGGNRDSTSPMEQKDSLGGYPNAYSPQYSEGRSPSYQGYVDPSSSPPFNPHRQQHHQQQQQQQYNPQRQSYTSNDDGGFTRREFNRDSQAGGYPPSLRGDDSFRGQQPNSSRNGDVDPRNFSNPVYQQYPSPTASSSSSSRPQLLQQQKPYNHQQQLRDGFAPDSDSARNSLAQSDASGGRRVYQPALAERQRLQQQLGGPASGGMDPRRSSYTSHHSNQNNYSPQSPYNLGRHHGAMDSFQRDSYSGESSTDGHHHQRGHSNNHPASHQVVVKQLRPWDTSFPDLEVVTAKQHGSFDDLLDPGNRVGRQSARGPGGVNSKPTFNARSKSHENFSRLPPEARPPGTQQHQSGQQQQYSAQQQHPYNSHGTHNTNSLSNDGHQSFRDSTKQPFSGSPHDGSGHQNDQRHMGHPYPPQQQQQQQSPAGNFSSLQSSPHERQMSRDGYPPYSSSNHPHSFRNSFASSTNVVQPYNPNASNQKYPNPTQGDTNSSFIGSLLGNNNQSYQARPLSLSSSAQGAPSPPGSSHNYPHQYSDKRGQDSNNPHTYVNFPNREPVNTHRPAYQGSAHPKDQPPNSAGSAPPPGRPPYPVAVRRQMVEEMAQVQTPVTQKDFLTAAELNQQRMQQPSYFQYPSPRDQYGNKIPPETNLHNVSQASLHSAHHGSTKNLPNSRLSSASRASTASRRDDNKRGSDLPDSSKRGGVGGGQGSSPHEMSFSRTNMMDPEAQKLRMAYERVHSLRMAPDKAPPKRKPAPIQTVKEDPNMSDREVLETNLQKIAKKNPLAGPRLRMSISAGDLIGKTHDELVLLLIQLRRNQAALEKARDYYRTLIDRCRPDELEYKRQMHQFGNVQDHRLLHRHQSYIEARGQTEEVENKLEVYKPIINLLDNMVTMGSLYGGDNLMLATQYRKHLLRPDQYQPPKKMLEFSRQYQEQRLQQETEEEIRQLSSDEVDLEEKIDRLNELDRLLQEQSFKVSSFREDKELLEKALVGVLKQQDQSYHGDPREMTRLTNQQRMLEKEISRVTQQLAEASKELEETSAENNKLEHEVALLRNKVHGELSRSRSAPSLSSENVRTKQQMEKELAKVNGIMAGLNQQGQKLQQAMSTIRRSSSSSHLAAANLDKLDGKEDTSPTSPHSTYLQTDLDSGEQVDLAQASSHFTSSNKSYDSHAYDGEASDALIMDEALSRPVINHQRQNAGSLEDWDVEGVDENTKRFFGLMPRDKPKGQTLREVKRLSEQRKERDKGRRDGDDSMDGQEIKLRVSNVDTEVSSIIHARIPSDAANKLISNGSNPNGSQYESSLPLYENLPGSSKTNPSTGSSNDSSNYTPLTARRSSLILMAPKPFTPYQDRSSARPFKSELALDVAASQPQDSGASIPAVWQPSNSTATVNDRPYRSVDFLNAPFDSSTDTHNANQPSFNSDFQQKTGGSSLYSSDANNNDNSTSYNNNASIYENDYIPQGQNQANTLNDHNHQISSYQYQSTESSHQALPSESANHITRPVDPNDTQTSTSRAYAARPWATKGAQFVDNIFNSRRNSRGRYMTISSSEPLKMEINPTLHSSAGDLILNRPIDNVPDIVKSSQSKVDQIDEDTIDREILYVPDKVLIPERYDAEADAEQLTVEESLARKERAERIRKVLTSQSVLSMSQPDVSQLVGEDIHSRVRQEKKEREHFLALNQELARQVTLKSKKQAAERRKTWSGAQFADAKAQYEAEMAGSPTSSPLRSPDGLRKRAEITLHDL
ncbi:hypothetical protein RRG08_025182 [Elysia crispata]|uniref:Pleckstrin homology domain-containing family A member 7 n=1 Tax=Elysia crispata TaxID=231223 RepID=A0AAE0ZD34_9GAST|nr:hypothetical protein RRG08_025182 [Elysia crispata]